MKRKEFLVVGLGRFGTSVAVTLEQSGCRVLAVDKDKDKVQDVLSFVTHAVMADATDPEQLQELGVKNYDGAILAIGSDLEVSILITILLKEMGMPFVLAKAMSDLQARILKKIGADQVIFPEKEMGVRVATKLTMGNFFDAVELSATYSLMEIDALKEWEHKALRELNLRAKHELNVIGIRHGDELEISPGPDSKIGHNDIVIVIGKNDVLNSLVSKNAGKTGKV